MIQKPDLETARLVLVVGAALPIINPASHPHIEPTVTQKGIKEEAGTAWFHIIPDVKREEGARQLASPFAIKHYIMVGTVDEIVVRFRQQIEEAARQVLLLTDSKEVTMLNIQESAWKNQAEMQIILDELFANHTATNQGKAVLLPWADHAHPHYIAYLQAKQENEEKLSAPETRRLGEDWTNWTNEVWLELLKSEDKARVDGVMHLIRHTIEEQVSQLELELDLPFIGIEVVNNDPIHLKLFEIDVYEADFLQSECCVESLWRERLSLHCDSTARAPKSA